jgi:hypothetical protein
MDGNQLPDELNFGGANWAAPISKLALHEGQLRESPNGTQIISVLFSLLGWR